MHGLKGHNPMKQDEIDEYLLLLLVFGMLDGFEIDFSIDGELIDDGLTSDLGGCEDVLFPDEFF